MSYGDDIRMRREGRLSRNALADKTGIRPGRMWAIEHGTGQVPSPEETAAIEAALSNLPVTPVTSTPRGARVATPKPKFTRPTAPTVSLSRAATGIDWASLRKRADEVSTHDLERYTIGPDPEAGFRLISNSLLRTFQNCPRKWWLAYHRKLRLRRESPLGPLAIGDRVHRALRAYYVPDGYTRMDPREALERLIVEDWNKVLRVYEPGDLELIGLEKTFTDEADLERIVVDGYVGWIAETGMDADYAVISSEQYVEAVLPLGDGYDGERVKLIGKLDTRVRRRTDGVNLFIDHKVLASITGARNTLHMDPQMLHYQLIESLNAAETGDRCDGALYNMLRKVKRSVNAKPPFYDRVEVRHNRHELDAYRRRVITVTKQIIDTEDALNDGEYHLDVVPANATRDCVRCTFFPVCPMLDDSSSRAEDMIKEYYTTHDVFDYYHNDMEQIEGIE